MNFTIPEYILSLEPYSPGKPMEELEREYGIKDPIKLASNENPLGPSPKAIEAIQRSLISLNRYPDGAGFNLLQIISEKLEISTQNIVLGNGSDDIIGMLAHALLKPGDEVIIPRPSFLMYNLSVQSVGAKPVYVPLSSLKIDLNGIMEKISDRCRIIFLCNPNNPTGSIIRTEEFLEFVSQVPRDIVIVVDEAYIEFTRDPECLNSLEHFQKNNRLVTLRTFSKVYGLAGLRIGFGVMTGELAEILNRVRLPFNASSMAQIGAIAAIQDEAFMAQTVALVHKGLDFFYGEFDKLGVRYVPTQANFFLIEVGRSADEVFKKMLSEGVIVRSMSSYGYPEFIRINVGLQEENVRFLNAFKKVMAL